MDTRTGEIKSLDDWNQDLGEEEVQKRIKSKRLVTGSHEELDRKWKKDHKLHRLMNGTKNQRKKYRQLTRKRKGK